MDSRERIAELLHDYMRETRTNIFSVKPELGEYFPKLKDLIDKEPL